MSEVPFDKARITGMSRDELRYAYLTLKSEGSPTADYIHRWTRKHRPTWLLLHRRPNGYTGKIYGVRVSVWEHPERLLPWRVAFFRVGEVLHHHTSSYRAALAWADTQIERDAATTADKIGYAPGEAKPQRIPHEPT